MYDAVRRVLATGGCHIEAFGTPDWNPLSAYIRPGAKVFVLCNFVQHRRTGERPLAFAAKCVHGSMVRAIVDFSLLASLPDGVVRVGNAPLQSAEWEAVLRDTGTSRVLEFYSRQGAAVRGKDLRARIVRHGKLAWPDASMTAQETVSVALGSDSFLADFDASTPDYRVLDYDPRQTEACHSSNQHRYLINSEVLDSDVIVVLSKLKTHEKVGLTCGIKAMVGAVSEKHCLAHHRRGSPSHKGDQYPSDSPLLSAWNTVHEFVCDESEPLAFRRMAHVVDRLCRPCLRRMGHSLGGAWYGNDTAWRMAVDLARICTFADRDGHMRTTPQRTVVSFVDGVVGGEGAGPLSPTPVDTGIVLFSDDLFLGDWLAARVSGIDVNQLRFLSRRVQESLSSFHGDPESVEVMFNGIPAPMRDISAVHDFALPPGWSPMTESRSG